MFFRRKEWNSKGEHPIPIRVLLCCEIWVSVIHVCGHTHVCDMIYMQYNIKLFLTMGCSQDLKATGLIH